MASRPPATVEDDGDDGDYSDVQKYVFDPKPGDVIIALMGVTGVGKSTFVSHCTDEAIAVNTGLRSCTDVVTAYRCRLDGFENVYLIDTPGFDDTYRSDIEVLTEIAEWLTDTYRRDVRLSGIIYLHRITDLRMTGSAKENYLRFQRLCGPEALRRVILATSMWEGVDPAVGAARERELAETEEFWGYMLRHHSQMHRHYNTAESARRLIGVFAGSGSAVPDPVSLRLQEEIVDQGLSLIETQVGRGWERALDKERDKYRQELEDIRAAMKEQLSKELSELEGHMQEKLERSEKDRAALKTMMEAKSMSHTKELKTIKEELGSVSKHLDTEKGFTRRVVKSLEEHAKGLDLRTRSRPSGESSVDGDIHISIHGPAFAFCGPKYTVIGNHVVWNNFPLVHGKSVKEKPHQWTASAGESTPHLIFEFGYGGESILHYSKVPAEDPGSPSPLRTRSCFTEVVLGTNNRYPQAQASVKTFGQSNTCIRHVSLGDSPGFPFYIESIEQRARLGARPPRPPQTSVFKQTFKGFPEEDEDAVRRIWWGYNNAYVVERKDGSRTWSLGSYYPGLSDFIRWGIKGCNTIKALSLDHTNPGSAWIIIFTNGEVAYGRRGSKAETSFDHFEFEEFATRNFGCDLGLIEESKMEGTPRSSNPMSSPRE